MQEWGWGHLAPRSAPQNAALPGAELPLLQESGRIEIIHPLCEALCSAGRTQLTEEPAQDSPEVKKQGRKGRSPTHGASTSEGQEHRDTQMRRGEANKGSSL